VAGPALYRDYADRCRAWRHDQLRWHHVGRPDYRPVRSLRYNLPVRHDGDVAALWHLRADHAVPASRTHLEFIAMRPEFYKTLLSPVWLVILLLAAVLPPLLPSYYLHIIILSLVYVALASAWNIVG